jgi:hypothetical protein
VETVPGASTIFAGHKLKFSQLVVEIEIRSLLDWYSLNLEDTVSKIEIAQTVRDISNF